MSNHSYEIVMPMAGLGQRFKDQKFNTPKPMILSPSKRPLFLESLMSLKPLLEKSRISFIVCKEDHLKEQIENSINELDLNFQIIEIEKRTQGPAETVLMSKDYINNDLPLLSIDCDLSFHSQKYFDFIKENQHTGVLCYFNADNPRYSYIKADDTGHVLSIAEKKVISNKALIGSYYFSKATDLFQSIENLTGQSEETFISHAIQSLLHQSHSFISCEADQYSSFGTPEELELSKT